MSITPEGRNLLHRLEEVRGGGEGKNFKLLADEKGQRVDLSNSDREGEGNFLFFGGERKNSLSLGGKKEGTIFPVPSDERGKEGLFAGAKEKKRVGFVDPSGTKETSTKPFRYVEAQGGGSIQ